MLSNRVGRRFERLQSRQTAHAEQLQQQERAERGENRCSVRQVLNLCVVARRRQIGGGGDWDQKTGDEAILEAYHVGNDDRQVEDVEQVGEERVRLQRPQLWNTYNSAWDETSNRKHFRRAKQCEMKFTTVP